MSGMGCQKCFDAPCTCTVREQEYISLAHALEDINAAARETFLKVFGQGQEADLECKAKLMNAIIKIVDSSATALEKVTTTIENYDKENWRIT